MISLLIKPVSGACNLTCEYCFYNDVTGKRERKSMGWMSMETLEKLVKSALSQAKRSVTFAFQGGEPTLAGLDFYRALVVLQSQHNENKVQIHNSIQTNGISMDPEWASFFTENDFLVGLSLDGDKESHELYRGNSFNRVMNAARIMEKCKTQYNILCVVTSNTARHIGRIYAFFKRNRFRYLQFIPCLDKLGDERGGERYSLTPAAYGEFLIRLFDLWHTDFFKGEYTSIRHFDNYIQMLAGRLPESCGLSGVCACYFVVEADGSVYPCDFYVLDAYRIGTIEDRFEDMRASARAAEFIEESKAVPDRCVQCEFYAICRNGCKRDRVDTLNYFCDGYKAFFTHALPRMKEIARKFT